MAWISKSLLLITLISATAHSGLVSQDRSQRMDERSIQGASGAQSADVSLRIMNRKAGPSISSRRGQVSEALTLSRDSVVFPGMKDSFVPKVPDQCRKTGICEELPDYPEEHVDQLITKLSDSMKSTFKVDELLEPEIAQRIGSPDEMELCNSRTAVVLPRAAPNKDGEWRYIVNKKDRAEQGVRVEICRQENGPCSSVAQFSPGFYEAHCKQKFILRQLSALNETGSIVQEVFSVPSCCSCVYKAVE